MLFTLVMQSYIFSIITSSEIILIYLFSAQETFLIITNITDA